MLLHKPLTCTDCVYFDKSSYFVPDKIVPGSKVLFIFQAPGEDEEKGHKLTRRHFLGGGKFRDEFQDVKPEPLIGATGNIFNAKFLPLTGLKRNEISLANAIRCRPGLGLGLKKANDLPNLTNKMKLETSKADIVKALRYCKETHLKIPSSVEVIVASGSYAWFSLTGHTQVLDNYKSQDPKNRFGWRGYALSTNHVNLKYSLTLGNNTYDTLDNEVKILCTLHIAALFQPRFKIFYHAVMRDMIKVKKLLSNKWPLPLPTWKTVPPTTWPQFSSFDTEYHESSGDLIRWSLSDNFFNTYCIEASDSEVIGLSEHTTVLAQNMLADINHLAKIIDITQITIEDLMLAHSVLFTGEPHGLNFIASIFGAFNKYKHLSDSQPQLYSALDAYEPMYCWKGGLLPQFQNDPQSWKVYREKTIPLISIINKAQLKGVRINQEKLALVKDYIVNRLAEIEKDAKLLTGDNDFNIGGRVKMLNAIYGEEEDE